VTFSRQSIYGEVTVLQVQDQYTFFADGLPVFTSPVPDIVIAEELVHLPMLYTSESRSALVLSGGLGGVIRELAKYPFKRIDYAELDPLLIEAVERFPSALTERELSDPRIRIENVDGRSMVRRKVEEERVGVEYEYDLVVVNLPPPTTLQLNRFYTVETFRMVNMLMAESGVLVLKTPGTLSYMNEELRALNRSIQQTLHAVFPYVRPIPDETTLWLASQSDALDMLNLGHLIERWDQRGLDAQLITAPHIALKLDDMHRTWFLNELATGADQGEEIAVNSDLHPVGLMHGIAYWSSLFSPRMARILQPLQRLNLGALVLPSLGLGALALIALRRNETRGQIILPVVVGSTGFAGMAADLLVIFAFQSLYGYVYQWVGLLIAAFMAGLGLGGLWITRRLGTLEDKRRTLVKIEIAMVAFWILLPGGLALFYSGLPSPASVGALQWALPLLNGLAGFMVGAQFPLSNSMWIKERALIRRRAGALYAFDLIGAFLAAILVAVVFVPILGLIETCLLAAVIKAISLLLSLQLPSTVQPA
jgi:spermidine synthase